MSNTFLGSPGIGNLRGEERFPVVARKAVRNAQTRHNISHATHTVRAKRNEVVSERSDWEVLRLAGSALRQNVMARLPESQLDDVAAVVAGCSVGIATTGTIVLDAVRPPTLVSGPSARSDTELERVEKLRGPRTLDVLIVE